MLNFTYYNPVKIIFGKSSIKELSQLVAPYTNILFAYGGGSIKKNGVYDQVKHALLGKHVVEFEGIEVNPDYDTLMKATKLCKERHIDFVLAVGGGSVIDGCKFIIHAVHCKSEDPWQAIMNDNQYDGALPLGCVLTLPATGSEMNSGSVISRRSTAEKKPFTSAYSYPKFSILDPESTYTLPERQTVNGIIDAFVHVSEQYLTYNMNAPLQTRQSEAILKTLIEEGTKVIKIKFKDDYDVRANIMWCATNALNDIIGLGVPQDWATHMIGHELTASYGIDHAQTLAIILPAVLRHQFANKKLRLAEYAINVWNSKATTESGLARAAIDKTEKFFRSLGAKTRLSEYKIPKKDLSALASRINLSVAQQKLGELGNIGEKELVEILEIAFPKFEK